MLKRFLNKIKSKKGNSYLFMPFMVIFGVTLMYTAMEMGLAYTRQVELQTITDATARAGIYAGMTGNGAAFYKENDHIFVNLDDPTAQGVARAILDKNLDGLTGIKKASGAAKGGQYQITSVMFNPTVSTPGFPDTFKNKKVPIWYRDAAHNGLSAKYRWMKISNFKTSEQIYSSGNFYVVITGNYKTMIANRIINRQSIKLNSFASALATAKKKP